MGRGLPRGVKGGGLKSGGLRLGQSPNRHGGRRLAPVVPAESIRCQATFILAQTGGYGILS